jgi:23S rRNA (guanine745-N1)-methyltransferase
LLCQNNRLVCPKRHSFDLARSGYVNLLPVQNKHSKLPGDNKLMASSRRDFLNKGYYEPLSAALNACCITLLSERSAPALLDAGCGEGYYTTRLYEALSASGIEADTIGLDISKFALDLAAKRCKKARFAVASAFHMPVPSAAFDLVLNLFAPFAKEEYQRILKPGGLFVMAVPGKHHLWELKEAVYPHPYSNEVRDPALEGFALLSQEHLSYRICLPEREDIHALFTMTPYYYKTSAADQSRLEALDTLETQVEFELFCYKAV